MRSTRIILVEGIPGSGKSTLGQFVESQLAASGVRVTWWYEEQKGHPLYLFDDEASLRAVVEDLRVGRFQQLVDAALEKWRQLVEEICRGDGVVVLDSCLFGYLTWSLFLFDAPVELITSYVLEIDAILRLTSPCLIYLHQDDVWRTLTRVCDARGRQWADSFVAKSARDPYVLRRGLQGFAGLTEYWTDYQAVTRLLFDRLGCAKLKIEGSGGDWPLYQEQIARFLELPLRAQVTFSEEFLRRLVGTYVDDRAGEVRATSEIRLEDGTLYASGLPEMWPRNRLIPVADRTFRVASFPCDLGFVADESGAVREMRLRGRELLSGRLDQVFVRR